MSIAFLLLLAVAMYVIHKITLDLPALNEYKPWVQVMGIGTVLLTAAFVIVIAIGWGRKQKRDANWWRLKICSEDISTNYQPIVYAKINNQTVPHAARAAWISKTTELLDSQIENPILLGDDKALGQWRSSQNLARQAAQLESSGLYETDPKVFFAHAEGIIKGVLETEVAHVLFSDEPGAARPAKARP